MPAAKQPRNTERNFLEEVVSPANAEIDFVAIHGLNPTNVPEHARRTWTARNGDVWLTDDRYLRRRFPQARVLLFGYNSSVAIESSTAGVTEQVRNLLDLLRTKRSQSPTRPLIFLCHSLGGLIAKKALVTAKLEDEFFEIYKSTCCLVFFGTPHWGSTKAPIGDIVAKIVRTIRGESRNTFMEVLKANSLLSDELRDNFSAFHNQFSFLSFYETRRTRRSFGVVVTKDSATLGASPHEQILPRETDHSQVCTYDDPDGQAFQQLIDNLKRVVNGPSKPVMLSTGTLILTAGPGALRKWDFTNADIATMAGAGRNTSTWLTANFKDRSLLEYQDVRSEDLLRRRGLVTTAELQSRWGKSLTLYQNGKSEKYTTVPKDDLDIFTWVMVLIYASLSAALGNLHCKDIMMEFVISLFDENSEDYLRAELASHIEGWNSIATVRQIAGAARSEWEQLERMGEHPAGCIPDSDRESVLSFLRWVTTERESSKHHTASSDVYCLAKVLCNIGITRLMGVRKERLELLEFNENHLLVIFNQDAISASGATASSSLRRGMRVPLTGLRESISPWPLSAAQLMNVLDDFSVGESVGKDLEFKLCCKREIPHTSTTTNNTKTDLYYEITSKSAPDGLVRRDGLGSLARSWFPLNTKSLRIALEARFPEWTESEYISDKEICANKLSFARFQCFLLGYYYGTFRQLIVDDELTTKEAFGSWGWWDPKIFAIVKDFLCDRPQKPTETSFFSWRFGSLKIMAYLFAGAELELLARLDSRATGVVAKLCLLSASMVGEAYDVGTASRFYLLDIDRSCIPNTSGIVMSGRRTPTTPEQVTPEMRCDLPIEKSSLSGSQKDFTIHIEPDWGHDTQTCMVIYRDNGRIVHRLSPADCDAATVLCAFPAESEHVNPFEAARKKAFGQAREEGYLVPLSRFHGGKVVTRKLSSSTARATAPAAEPLFIPTMDLPRAKTCLRAMVFDSLAWKGYTPKKVYALGADLAEASVLYDEDARPIVFV